jgi:hypothetical protein
MVIVLFIPLSSFCQVMQGQIIDVSNTDDVDNVSIVNIHKSATVLSDKSGHFSLNASEGDLVEFRKDGYKTIRLRIPAGKLPYYRVAMDRIAAPAAAKALTYTEAYKADSERYYAMYKQALEFPQMSGLDMIRHPFSAISNKNQQTWAFQKEFSWFQQQKFIDYAFNEKIISAITGLKGDSAVAYMRIFRPTYDQIRNMNEYMYFVYLKKTVEAYRERGVRARMSPTRGSN